MANLGRRKGAAMLVRRKAMSPLVVSPNNGDAPGSNSPPTAPMATTSSSLSGELL
jgi:hypothetical protein